MAIQSSSILMINLKDVNINTFFIKLFAQEISLEILNPKELGKDWAKVTLNKPQQPDFRIEEVKAIQQVIKDSLNYNFVESLTENRAVINLKALDVSHKEKVESLELAKKVLEYRELEKSFKKLLKIPADKKKAKIQKQKLKQARIREKELHKYLQGRQYNFSLNQVSSNWLKKMVLGYTEIELENKIYSQSQNIFKINKNSDNNFIFLGLIPTEKAKLIEFLESQKIDFQNISWNKEIVTWSNPSTLAPFQNIAQSLGTIGKKEFDPSAVISIFFALFFALCINDALYGLVISGITGYFLFFQNLKKKFQSIFTLFFFSGIVSILVGAISNSWAGNLLATTPFGVFTENFQLLEPLDPGKDVIINNFLRNNGGINPIVAMLGFAVFIGLLHIFTGLIINISNTAKIKNMKDAMFELNWVIFLVALLASFIGVLGPNTILGISFPVLIVTTVGLFVMNSGKGIAGKVIGGFIKLYEIVAFLADMLSYTRLIAVGLTGSIIATVINLLASIAYQGSGPILGIFAVAIILVIGHAFNLIVGMFGAYINPLRLHYVEFMPKFFQGDARALNTIDNELTYAIIDSSKA